MASKKTLINLTLIDGTAEGALKCINKVQDGVIFRINRDDVNNHLNMAEMKQCGIYFLFGYKSGKPAVYIGQANTRKNGNGVLGRVLEHKKPQEDYWTQAFILISSGNTIGATELNYLENQFCNMAIYAKKYQIINAADPNTGNYSDEIEITMDPLIDYTATCLKVLGYDLFGEPVNVDQNNTNDQDGLMLFLKRSGGAAGRGCDAKCVLMDGKYIILKGSVVATMPTGSCPKYVRDMRQSFADKVDKKGKMLEDIEFDKPSGASSFIVYGASNGNVEFVNATGEKLADIINSL